MKKNVLVISVVVMLLLLAHSYQVYFKQHYLDGKIVGHAEETEGTYKDSGGFTCFTKIPGWIKIKKGNDFIIVYKLYNVTDFVPEMRDNSKDVRVYFSSEPKSDPDNKSLNNILKISFSNNSTVKK